MFRKSILAGSLAIGLSTSAVAISAEPTHPTPNESAAPQPSYSTEATDIGTLLDNPQAKAILEKHLPQLTSNPQFEMARAMTLKQIQSYAADAVTDDVLAKIDVDLAKLPPKS